MRRTIYFLLGMSLALTVGLVSLTFGEPTNEEDFVCSSMLTVNNKTDVAWQVLVKDGGVLFVDKRDLKRISLPIRKQVLFQACVIEPRSCEPVMRLDTTGCGDFTLTLRPKPLMKSADVGRREARVG